MTQAGTRSWQMVGLDLELGPLTPASCYAVIGLWSRWPLKYTQAVPFRVDVNGKDHSYHCYWLALRSLRQDEQGSSLLPFFRWAH